MFKFTHTTPTRQTANAAGADIYAQEKLTADTGSYKAVFTGIETTLPACRIMVVPRSSMRRKGLRVDFGIMRGEIMLMLRFDKDFHISEGERYAQIIVLDSFLGTNEPVFAKKAIGFDDKDTLIDTTKVYNFERDSGTFGVFTPASGIDANGDGIIDSDYIDTVKLYIAKVARPVPASEPVGYITTATHVTGSYFPTLEAVRDGGFGSTGL
jgi:dUTPase